MYFVVFITASIRFGQYRNHSPLWVPTGANGQLQTEVTDYKDKRVKSRSQFGGVSGGHHHYHHHSPQYMSPGSPRGPHAAYMDLDHDMMHSAPTASRNKRPWVAKVGFPIVFSDIATGLCSLQLQFGGTGGGDHHYRSQSVNGLTMCIGAWSPGLM